MNSENVSLSSFSGKNDRNLTGTRMVNFHLKQNFFQISKSMHIYYRKFGNTKSPVKQKTLRVPHPPITPAGILGCTFEVFPSNNFSVHCIHNVLFYKITIIYNSSGASCTVKFILLREKN